MKLNAELKTQRLVLKPLGTEHIDSAHRYSSDLENTRLMMNLPNESREETMDFLVSSEREWAKEEPDFYEFAVLLDGAHIGAVSIYRHDRHGTWEFGWIIDKSCWGFGYAAEAARAVLREAADRLGARRFIAHCDSENSSSARVMEKLGMRLAETSAGRRNRSSQEKRKEFRYELNTENM